MIGDQRFELGEPQFGFEPDSNADFTWHVHDLEDIVVKDPEGWPQWGTGIKCTACAKPKPEHGGGKTVRFMTERLRQHREAGTTAVGMEKEIIDSARADGRLDKIDRAR